ncbi:MAG: hypothetical protein RLZZ244_1637 [Verrucomicrobiota bacterium]
MEETRLEHLAHGFVDGRLSAAEVAELDAYLRSEPEARRHFWTVARLHGELRIWGERGAAQGHLGATLAQMEPVEGVGWGRRIRALGKLAAVFALGALLGWLGRGAVWGGVGGREGAENVRWLGRMVVDGGAVYAPGCGPGRGGEMGAGVYEMLEGSGHVRLENGVDLTLRAPVRFVLHDPLHVTLEYGALRALVSESAQGFTVRAPDADFEDLGTEFGVEVDGTGRSQMRVFDGEVRVKPGRGTGDPELVKVGESVRVEGKAVRPVERLSEEGFPSKDGVAYRRWQEQSVRMRRDPALVFYYDFEADPADPGRLADVAAAGHGLDGRIVGAQWVSGRWAGKRGLQFENPGDGVWISIPGEHADLTLAGWMRLDRLENALNALLNTSGWGPGGFHWQINRSGRLTSSGLMWGGQVIRSQGDPVPLGKWSHFAVVLDSQTQELRFYLDGRPCGLRRIGIPGYKACLERACIGRLAEWSLEDTRELRGRIDELAMWNRALSAEEVGRLAEWGGLGVQGRSLAEGSSIQRTSR